MLCNWHFAVFAFLNWQPLKMLLGERGGKGEKMLPVLPIGWRRGHFKTQTEEVSPQEAGAALLHL